MHEKIWDHLYNEGLASQKHIEMLHEEQKDKIDV